MFLFTQWYYCEFISRAVYIDGLVLHCSVSSALAMEILQRCTKPSISSQPKGVGVRGGGGDGGGGGDEFWWRCIAAP